MTPDGDVVAVWSGNGVGDQHGIFFRRYNEPTDTAGPMATGMMLPDGTPVSANGSVTASLRSVIVTFDEALDPSTATNLNNYSLMCNGVQVSGALVHAYYGLDAAMNYAGQFGIPSNIGKTNKYQVILVFSMDLPTGNYQIFIKNSIRDVAGNALYHTGYNVNGMVVRGILNVIAPTGTEGVVNPNATLSYDTANAVASDADGDSVAVWIGGTSNPGVWAGIYNQTTTANADGTQSTSFVPVKQFQINTDPATTQFTDASVAMDKDGDFVVTWSAFNTTNPLNDFDVYAEIFQRRRRRPHAHLHGEHHHLGHQQAPSVAMDLRGDFVVTWQSRTSFTDPNGYDVIAERFSPDGKVLAGTDEEQAIAFDPAFSGTFQISWHDDLDNSDKTTAPITWIAQGGFQLAGNVEDALNNSNFGADVVVTASSATGWWSLSSAKTLAATCRSSGLTRPTSPCPRAAQPIS